MRRLLIISSLVLLSVGLAFATSPRVTAIGMSGAAASLDSTVGPGGTVYVVGEFTHPGDTTAVNHVYFNTSTGLDKIRIYYYSASPPTGGSLITSAAITPSNVQANNSTNAFSFNFAVPSNAPAGTQSFQILFGLQGFDEINLEDVFGDRRTSYLTISSYSACNDPVDANHKEYMLFEADTQTQAPTLTTPAAGARDNQNFNISYTLPEAAASGTVKLIFVETGGANAPYTDVDTLTLTSSYETIGTHSFVLDGTDLNSSTAIVASESGNFGALVDSSIYSVKIQYQDASINPIASDDNANILYDNNTYPPTFVTPAASGYSTNTTVAVDYTLPEAASYVKLLFTRTGGTEDNGSPHTLTLWSGARPIGQHQFNLAGDNIGTNSAYVDVNPWGAVDSLVMRSVYRVTLMYKDEMGNDEEQVVHNAWTYFRDTATETPILDEPDSGGRDNNSFYVAFTLPEAALSGTVKLLFTRTAGTADPAGYHELTLSYTGSAGFSLVGTNLIEATAVISVAGGGTTAENNTLVDGSIYSVVVKYQDAAGNPEATSTASTGVIFDNSTSAPTLDMPAANSSSGSPIAVQYDQPEAGLTGSAKLTFTRSGGTLDAGSPHVLTLSNISSGTDKTLSVVANNLSSTAGVSSITGGNQLINLTIYTVKIEYKDDLGNAAASAENGNFTYTTGVIVYAVGSDVNEGGGFLPGSTNNPVFELRLNTNTSSAMLTAVTFATSGTADNSDIQLNGNKLWYSTDGNFDPGEDTQIGTIQDFAIGTMMFSGLTQSIGTAYSYFFFTIDVSSTASSTDNVLATIQSPTDIAVGSSQISGDFPMGSTSGHPLPVEITSFSASPGYGQVILQWRTASETDNAGFKLFRATQSDGNYVQIASYQTDPQLEGQGTIATGTQYTYNDPVTYAYGTVYFYKLESVDINGNVEEYGEIASASPFEPIEDYRLDQNYPNPFNPETTIPYQLTKTSKVTIKIYDILGREVATVLNDAVQPMGRYKIRWDGTSNGIPVASGTYYYRIQANRWTQTRSMILIR
jgi:hypothetical protein